MPDFLFITKCWHFFFTSRQNSHNFIFFMTMIGLKVGVITVKSKLEVIFFPIFLVFIHCFTFVPLNDETVSTSIPFIFILYKYIIDSPTN